MQGGDGEQLEVEGEGHGARVVQPRILHTYTLVRRAYISKEKAYSAEGGRGKIEIERRDKESHSKRQTQTQRERCKADFSLNQVLKPDRVKELRQREKERQKKTRELDFIYYTVLKFIHLQAECRPAIVIHYYYINITLTLLPNNQSNCRLIPSFSVLPL